MEIPGMVEKHGVSFDDFPGFEVLHFHNMEKTEIGNWNYKGRHFEILLKTNISGPNCSSPVSLGRNEDRLHFYDVQGE